MSDCYHKVPWLNTAEWLKVYDLIYSPHSTFETKEEALNYLLVWKAKCPSLLPGVESTLTLLVVYIQDAKTVKDAVNEQLLRLAYSSAIMRFVNHMLDTETARQAAKGVGFPDWIIDMRRDAIYNRNLLSIEIFRNACSISLDWLQKNYWEKHKMSIKDYVVGQKETIVNDEYKIALLMHCCISVCFCAYSSYKMKNLSEIPDATMREYIVDEIRNIFGDRIDLSNLKTVTIRSIVKAISYRLKKLLRAANVNKETYVNKALLGEDSLFLSMDSLKANKLYHKNQLDKTYVQCFEYTLTFMHANDLLLEFLMELISISENFNSDKDRSHLSALWVSEILVALRKSKHFIDKMRKMNKSDFEGKNRKDLKLMYHTWYPDGQMDSLFLDFYKPVPKELTDMNFIRPIISRSKLNITYYVRDLLNLVKPHLPNAAKDEICELAKLSSVSSKVDDLTKAQEHSVDDDKSSEICDDIETNGGNNIAPKSHGILKLASKRFYFGGRPISLLPWPQESDEDAYIDT